MKLKNRFTEKKLIVKRKYKTLSFKNKDFDYRIIFFRTIKIYW